MTKVKVENKSRKQTVKVKTSSATTDHKSLLSRIDELEKQVSVLNELATKLAENSVKEHSERFKLEQMIDDNRKTNLKFVWGLWIVFALFVIVFGIVLN